MSENIKTGFEILNESEKDFNQTEWYNWKMKKWVSLDWLIKQIRNEIDLVNKKRGHQFDDNQAYQAGMFNVLELLKREE